MDTPYIKGKKLVTCFPFLAYPDILILQSASPFHTDVNVSSEAGVPYL